MNQLEFSTKMANADHMISFFFLSIFDFNFSFSQLDSKLHELKKNVTNLKPITPSNDNGRTSFNVMLMNDDDCMRTQYVPPEPTVKILKRPSNDKTKEQLLAEARPKAPIKTLQQREQEYAEARLRILGSAKSAEEEEEYVLYI